MTESTTSRQLPPERNKLGTCRGINKRLPTKALFSKRPLTPETFYGSSSQSGDSARSSRTSLFSPVFTHPEGSPEPDIVSLASASVHRPLSPRAHYTVSYFTTDMATSRNPVPWPQPAQTLCTCADDDRSAGPGRLPPDPESGVQAPTAVGGGGGGSTLVSIPIPVSVPLPLGQSGGGSQGGPIIITSPPPPAPPNPPMPPHPPAQRPGIAQDVASMLMMLLMNHVRERIDGTSTDAKNQQLIRDREVAAAAATAAVEAVSKAQLPKEPMVPAWMFREMLPGAGKKGSIDLDRKKKKTAKKKRGGVELAPPETPAPQLPPPPLVLPFPVQDAPTEALPPLQITKIPDESPKVSPEQEKEPKERSPDEEETPSGTYRVAVPFCDRCCCYIIVILLLGGVLAVNLAFLIAPEDVTNFLCELGLEERKNDSKNARLYDMDADNDTEVETLGQSSGLWRISGRNDKSIFDIEEAEHEDEPPPIPHSDVFESEEQPSVAHAATEASSSGVVEAPFAEKERCSRGNCSRGEKEEPLIERETQQYPKPTVSTSYLEHDDWFRVAWDALQITDKPAELDDQSGSFLDRALLRHLSARRTIWLAPSTSSVATTAQDFRHGVQRFGPGETTSTGASTRKKRRGHRDRLDAMMVAAVNTERALKVAPSGAVNHTPTAHDMPATALTYKWVSSAAPAGVQRKADMARSDYFTYISDSLGREAE
ncbi:hypothetical protein HPB49_012643 [Dermacentor silvarum]|uniref:Uncharacterized protein n=1 Tax=Dermacentor silvarum TaxID=543639 RepID=A0ACB8C961_DERSI|nr:hypothetical protein HPB49_012643 [Dermacentor silvarum]